MEKVKNKEELLDVSFNAMLLGKSIFAFVEFLSGLLLIFIPLDFDKINNSTFSGIDCFCSTFKHDYKCRREIDK
ncbi:hypothetical protein [Lactococcus cremoris]|uniref:hypothetical protein n=1 Tax=Lactococcus lactis subsp. cremoris TaxID=1359 RepID=UPI00223AA46B|nr:hypothetical protein [Lactococcus cremoris]